MSSVQDFRTRSRIYRLTEDGGVNPRSSAELAAPTSPSPVGFGDLVKVVFGEGSLGVAIYAIGKELRLVIGSKRFDLLQPGVRVERIAIFPFVKQFTIWRDAERLLSFRYLRADIFDDPHAGTRDILKFVAEIAESHERRLRFFLVWQAVQVGQDVTSDEARKKLEEEVRHLASGV